MSLLTAEGLGNIEVEDDGGSAMGLTVATVDVADAFHRMKMPDHLCEYFGMPSVTAGELGLRSLGGEALDPDIEVVPLASALPMGFTWSLFFAQDIDEEAAASVIDRCELLVDRGRPLLLLPSRRRRGAALRVCGQRWRVWRRSAGR